MGERKSDLFFSLMGALLLLLAFLFGHASYTQEKDAPIITEKRQMVGRLGLTDLCLFTDARYTRHPSVADLNTPFQDYPLSLEHFPSGSIISAPPHLKKPVSVSVSVESRIQNLPPHEARPLASESPGTQGHTSTHTHTHTDTSTSTE